MISTGYSRGLGFQIHFKSSSIAPLLLHISINETTLHINLHRNPSNLKQIMLFQFENFDLLNEIQAVLGFESFTSLVDWTIESNRRANGP